MVVESDSTKVSDMRSVESDSAQVSGLQLVESDKSRGGGGGGCRCIPPGGRRV